ncbi:ABC transporter ATP-binding protein/permease [Tissierella pigra]|uniref:ABC transporter ATP-binding protein n=1 Tax=Tissierella pigra TaxID=2607614 RepID=A0A6N7Y2Y0_9FIRM|nr:ABC transporter ATP-binding protein [Tissierella pigra]MBU5426388.1 ABC transporter ATP-binding protein/permease [Tissierella pigra]MSU03145.1 ABC transporter ATP-binding protein [Tissierella pigra]
MSREYDDEIVGKSYDSKLMKRLLQYAKPYTLYLLLAILMMVTITGLELIKPYLLKVTIDDYLSGYTKPMYEMEIDSTYEGIIFNNKKYVKVNSINTVDNLQLEDYPIVNIVKENGDYYLGDYEDKSVENRILLDNDSYINFRNPDIKGINKIALIFLVSIVLAFVLNYLQVLILNYTSQKIIFNIRQEIFAHIQSLSISFFDKNPIGRLVTRVTNDTETLNEMYTSVLVNLFKDIFVLIGIIFIMIKMNLTLALISFALVPLIIVASIIFRKKIRVVYRLARVQLSKINSTLNENLTGMRIIHIFKKENKISNQFDKINQDYLKTAKKEITLFAIFRPSIEVIRSLGIAFIIYYGGDKVISNSIEFGVLYAFIEYLQRFFQPILDLTEKYNILQSAMASSERIFHILDNTDIVENPNNPMSIDNIKGKIEFRNVWFAYESDNWVLKDISFIINPGETIAFVGATGAGKSSIMNLITRFYDIQKGEILIDDINIKEYNKYELRQKIGVVLQDVFLFTGTIEDNIRLNNTEISDDKIIEVAKYVNADYFINKLPLKYKEPVMERGSTLSSGERQLLSFARTLAYNPSILILDEATSSIDTETELLIQDALEKLIKGRTSIAVAHRLSTIQHADKIIVLSKGNIKEIGTHQELLSMEGMYYDLYRLQYKEDFAK